MKLRKGVLKPGVIQAAVLAIVILVILFTAYSEIIPEAQTAGDSFGDVARCADSGGVFNVTQGACLNGTSPADTGVVGFTPTPLSTLFSGTGVVFLIVMAALLVLVVRAYLSKK